MKKLILNVVSMFLLSLFMNGVVNAANTNDPVAMLQSIADQMISQLKSQKANLKSKPSVVYSIANKAIVPHADLDEMSRRVLPAKTWTGATAAQKSQFKKQFTITLERTYGSALADYEDQTIKFMPVRGGVEGKKLVKVDSQILRNDGPAIEVSYNLLRIGSQWKIYDMVVEGVSMLQSFRSQFADKLNRADMASLIKDLSQHNAEHSGS